MGEAKQKQAAVAAKIAEMHRPDGAILRLKAAIGASAGIVMDPDTKEFMADLGAAIDWIQHLETPGSVSVIN